jgi:hypothetical protein
MDVLKGISSIVDDVIPHGCGFPPRTFHRFNINQS